jgi:hypothetical protein
MCAPNPNKDLPFTCYSKKTLDGLLAKFNAENPQRQITNVNSYYELYEALVAKKMGAKRDESLLVDDQPKLKNLIFSPAMNPKWKKNPNEWLTSDDIFKVMSQYEHAFPEFEFLGPSPSDYKAFDEETKTCVWPELCNFDLLTAMRKGDQKFGVIFNLDTHEKSGSHWVALFINTNTRSIYYFDSTGAKIPTNIRDFVLQVQEDAEEAGMSYSFDQNAPVQHQRSNTECGVYTLFFIIMMIKFSDDVGAFASLFKNKQFFFTDKQMMELRKKMFNP